MSYAAPAALAPPVLPVDFVDELPADEHADMTIANDTASTAVATPRLTFLLCLRSIDTPRSGSGDH
ncbi:MAG TPA: hypothetical protein VGH01_01065 [Jatrophihabitantaceae bacterium]